MSDPAAARRPVEAPSNGISIAVEHVSMVYAGSTGQPTWALWDVSTTISPAEIVCAVGPSGCGKTTLLNMIAGFIKPTRGKVSIDGAEIDGPGPERGVVFQEYGLFPWATVRGNVEFGLRARGVPSAERTALAHSYLRLVGLEQAARSYPSELSGGMRQRVAVARALVNKPKLLLMDEPFAAVDALTRASLQDELVRLWQQGRWACFFITHSIEEAAYLGQKVLVLTPHPGRLKSVVTVDLPYPRDRHSDEFQRVARSIDLALQH